MASGNQIEEIRIATFENAKNLRYLVLPSNRIKYLLDFTFVNCRNLQTLKLHHNMIAYISSKTFFGLKELRSLILSHNRIAYLPLFGFSSLHNIETLAIDNNFIRVISYNQFSRNLQLTSLNLENNRITLIDNGTFENVPKLETLDLKKNLCIDFTFKAFNAGNQSELHCCINKTDETCVAKSYHTEYGTETSEVWVLVGTVVLVLVFGAAVLSALYYNFVFKSRRETRIKENDQIELVTKNHDATSTNSEQPVEQEQLGEASSDEFLDDNYGSAPQNDESQEKY